MLKAKFFKNFDVNALRKCTFHFEKYWVSRLIANKPKELGLEFCL